MYLFLKGIPRIERQKCI